MGDIPARVTARKSFRSKDLQGFQREVSDSLYDIQRQLGAQGRILPHEDGNVRPKMRKGDRGMGRGKRGTITVVPDGSGNVASQEVPDSVTQYQDPQSAAGAPAVANFPNSGDFGWYVDTGTSSVYFVFNNAGAISGPSLVSRMVLHTARPSMSGRSRSSRTKSVSCWFSSAAVPESTIVTS